MVLWGFQGVFIEYMGFTGLIGFSGRFSAFDRVLVSLDGMSASPS